MLVLVLVLSGGACYAWYCFSHMELASFGGPQVARAEKQQYTCGLHVDAGQVSEPVMLREMNMGMGKGFSSDITLRRRERTSLPSAADWPAARRGSPF